MSYITHSIRNAHTSHTWLNRIIRWNIGLCLDAGTAGPHSVEGRRLPQVYTRACETEIVCACACVRVLVCMHACVHACVRTHIYVRLYGESVEGGAVR